MSAIQKWFGTDTYRWATKALGVILQECQNPSYKQVIEVLECMRELVEEQPISFTK